MTHDLHAARFASVPADAGHYESFYLKLCDPDAPRGAWVRYTVLKRPHEPARGSLWCTLWTGDGPPRAHKVTLGPSELAVPPDGLIAVGASALSATRAIGATDGAAWELEYAPESETLRYLPRGWMYHAPLPRTKAVSLQPRARFRGQVTVAGETLTVDGWPGMVGHNWGREHAERWIWLHGTGFSEAPDAWLDATIGRVRLGGLTVPWVANGALWFGGRLRRLGGLSPGALRATSVEEDPQRCRFLLRRRDTTVEGEVAAPPGSPVAWRYSDPGGGEHATCNCSVASMLLRVRILGHAARVLHLPAGAAYELGAREPPAGIPLQPFSDP